jgi:hypothetical protein
MKELQWIMAGVSVALVCLSASFGGLPWGMFASAVGWCGLLAYMASEAKAQSDWHYHALQNADAECERYRIMVSDVREVLRRSSETNKKRLTWTEVAQAVGVK